MIRFDPITGRVIDDALDPFAGKAAKKKPQGFTNPNADAIDASKGFKLLDFDDAALFVPRGIEGAVRSTIDLVGGLAGFEPNTSETRLFGRSDTLIGGFAAGAVQIAAPFLVGGAAIKGLGLAAKLPAVLVDGIESIPGAQSTFLKALVKGGAADLIAFSGHEERFSNLIQRIPALQNPVTDFLQAKKDDTEVEGRIKNVLEGLGLGALVEGLLGGLRFLREGKKAIRKGEDLAKTAKVLRALEDDIKDSQVKMNEAAKTLGLAVDEVERPVPLHPEDPDVPLARQEPYTPDGAKARLEKRLNDRQKARDALADAKKERRTKAAPKRTGEAIIEALVRDPKRRVRQIMRDRKIITKAKFVELVNEFSDADADTLKRMGVVPEQITPELKVLMGLRRSGEMDIDAMVGLFGAGGKSPITKGDILDVGLTMSDAIGRILEEVPVKGVGKAERQAAASKMARLILSGENTGERAKALSVLLESSEILRDSGMTFLLLTEHRRERLSTLAAMAKGATPTKATLKRHGLNAGMDLETIYALGRETSADLELFRTVFDRVASNLGYGLQSTQGVLERGLALTEPKAGTVFAFKTAKEAKESLGDKTFDELLEVASVALNLEQADSQAALATINKIGRRGVLSRALVEHMIGSMLWSGQSITTNGLFPFMTAFYQRAENIVGGVLTGNAEKVSFEFDTIAGMMAAMPKAFKIFKATLKDGVGIDPNGLKTVDFGLDGSFLKAEVFNEVFPGFGPRSVMARAINYLGAADSVPGKIFNAEDSFTKFIVAQGEGTALLKRQARKLGADPTAYVQENIGKLYSEGVLATEEVVAKRVEERLRIVRRDIDVNDPVAVRNTRLKIEREVKNELNFDELFPITKRILERGREATATTRLNKDGGVLDQVGLAVQNLNNKVPLSRIITPFVTTATNILKFAGQRNPAAALPIVWRKLMGNTDIPEEIAASVQRNVREMFSGDKELVSETVGRIATGTGIMTGVAMMSDMGKVTGSGPDDPQQRQQMIDAGWQPYSIKIGNEYVSYMRADPIAVLVGTTADLMESARLSMSEEDSGPMQAVFMGLISSLANNLTDKSYATGIRQFFDAVSDPRGKSGIFLASGTGALFPRIGTQLARLTRDPVLRDAHNLVLRIREKTPFYGAPPLRNLFGEPVRQTDAFGAPSGSIASRWFDLFDPIAYRTVSDDSVKRELATIRHGFSHPSRTVQGVRPDDFVNSKGQDAYDRWSQLQGSVTIGGATLKTTLGRLIRSSEYQRLPLERTLEGTNPRADALGKIISRYRRAAWLETLREYPDLQFTIDQSLQRKQQLIDGFQPVQSVDPFRFQ